MERCGGPGALVGLIALFALLNGALIQVIKAARVLFGLAREGMLPERLGRVHPRTRTPVFATLCATFVVALLAFSLPLATLARATSNVTLVTFALANLALLRVKQRAPAAPGAPSVPAWVPAVGLVLNLALIGFQLTDGFA
jgi:amino acid transporter